MVGAVHHELDPAGDGAELADDELVADEGEVVEDVALEARRILRIVVIGVITHLDIGPDGVLDKAHLGKPFMGGVGGSVRAWGSLGSGLRLGPNGIGWSRPPGYCPPLRQSLSPPAHVRIDPGGFVSSMEGRRSLAPPKWMMDEVRLHTSGGEKR